MTITYLSSSSDVRVLREFGWIMGGMIGFISLIVVPFFYGTVSLWWVGIGCIFVGLGQFFPILLRPIYEIWMFIGEKLGRFNTYVLLILLFYCLITPLGLLRRLFKARDKVVYRKSKSLRPSTHLERPF